VLPRYGVVLGQTSPPPGPAVPPRFTDTWFLAHGAIRAR
jgi:hypothetical protein